MASLSDRVRERRGELGLTQGQLATMISRLGHKVTQSAIDRIEQRDTKRPRCLPELAQALGVTQDWLLTGKHSDRERNIPGAGNVLELDVRAGAGGGGFAYTHLIDVGHGMTINRDNAKDEVWAIPASYLRNELKSSAQTIFIVEIMGDSMAPTLNPGDRVMVNASHTVPSPDGIYALHDGVGVVVKRLEVVPASKPPRLRMISDNEHHAAYELTLDEVHVIGRIAGRISLM